MTSKEKLLRKENFHNNRITNLQNRKQRQGLRKRKPKSIQTLKNKKKLKEWTRNTTKRKQSKTRKNRDC